MSKLRNQKVLGRLKDKWKWNWIKRTHMVRVEFITFTTFSKQWMTLILAVVAVSAYFLFFSFF